jgi:predicted DNA binding protein
MAIKLKNTSSIVDFAMLYQEGIEAGKNSSETINIDKKVCKQNNRDGMINLEDIFDQLLKLKKIFNHKSPLKKSEQFFNESVIKAILLIF